jgi:rubrerythrin
MQVDLIQALLEHFEEELHDVQTYGRMAKQAEAAGHERIAWTLELIRRDEETHAAALHDILDSHAPDVLSKTLRDNPQLSELWDRL